MRRIFVSIFVICLLVLTGCSNRKTDTAAIPVDTIIANTIIAMNEVKSYRLSTDMTENYTVVQKSSPKTFTDTWEWQSLRQVDILNRQVNLFMNIHETPQIDDPYVLWIFLVGGWDYRNVLSPPVYSGAGQINFWIKNKLGEKENSRLSDFTQLSAQIELLQSADNIEFSGTAEINGHKYNVIQFNPSGEAAADWVLSQGGFDGPSIGWWFTMTERSKEIYVKAFKNSAVKIWIDKDDYSILKENISLNYDVVPTNATANDMCVNGNDPGFEHILVEFNGEWAFSDYNHQFWIQLPQFTLNAQDIGN